MLAVTVTPVITVNEEGPCLLNGSCKTFYVVVSKKLYLPQARPAFLLQS
jgi:hypothetical protein